LSKFSGLQDNTKKVFSTLPSGSSYVVGAVTIGQDGVMYVPTYNFLSAIDIYGSVKWQQSLSLSSPMVAALSVAETLYVGSTDGHLYALDLFGSIKWAYGTGGAIYSSPTISNNGIVYFGSTDNNLYAISSTGSIIWSYYMFSSIYSAPSISTNGTIYVGTYNGILYAMNPDGLIDWQFATLTGSFQYSSPVIGPDGSIYIGSASADNNLYAFSKTGSLKWTYNTFASINTSPALTPVGDIIVFSYNNQYIYCIKPNGTLVWRYSISSYATTQPVVGADGTIYISSDQLYALHPTGSLKWTSLTSVYPQTPVISSSGIIYTCSYTTVYAVGTLLSTQSPSLLPSNSLLQSSSISKFKISLGNTVDIYIVILSNTYKLKLI
jgi:outer membrane protein assembly factor BamB